MDTPPPPTSADDLFPEEPPSAFPVMAIAIAVIAAAVGAVGQWAVSVHLWHDQAVPILLPGLLVGLGVRFIAGGVRGNGVWLIMIIALVGAMAGFIWADTYFWKPFDISLTLKRAFSLMGILAFAACAYLAFRISLK